MIGADAPGGELQRRAILRRHARAGRVDLGLGEGDRLGRQLQPVQARRQLQHRLDAAPAHIRDDLGNRRVDRRVGALRARQQAPEGVFEAGIAMIEKLHAWLGQGTFGPNRQATAAWQRLPRPRSGRVPGARTLLKPALPVLTYRCGTPERVPTEMADPASNAGRLRSAARGSPTAVSGPPQGGLSRPVVHGPAEWPDPFPSRASPHGALCHARASKEGDDHAFLTDGARPLRADAAAWPGFRPLAAGFRARLPGRQHLAGRRQHGRDRRAAGGRARRHRHPGQRGSADDLRRAQTAADRTAKPPGSGASGALAGSAA